MTAVVPIDDPGDERVCDFWALNDPEMRRLREQPGGSGNGLLVAEGVLVIRQLLRSPYRLRSVLVAPQGLAALGSDLEGVDAPVYLASPAVMTGVAGFHFHRGRWPLPTGWRRPIWPRWSAVSSSRSWPRG
jgi:hypothetical protein